MYIFINDSSAPPPSSSNNSRVREVSFSYTYRSISELRGRFTHSTLPSPW